MKLHERDKLSFLLAIFHQSNLPPAVAAARSIYENHVSALAALRLARRLGVNDNGRAARAIAEREADAARARWRRSRERIQVHTWRAVQ